MEPSSDQKPGINKIAIAIGAIVAIRGLFQICTGRVGLGSHYPHEYISVATSPHMFWLIVGGTFAFSAICFLYAFTVRK